MDSNTLNLDPDPWLIGYVINFERTIFLLKLNEERISLKRIKPLEEIFS